MLEVQHAQRREAHALLEVRKEETMTADAKLVRSLVLEYVPRKRHHARTGRQIFEDVDAAYGSLYERRFWRVLKRLIDAGLVVRVGKLHSHSEYHKHER